MITLTRKYHRKGQGKGKEGEINVRRTISKSIYQIVSLGKSIG